MKLFESFEINIKENIKEIYIEEKSGKFEIEDFFNNYKMEQIEEYFY